MPGNIGGRTKIYKNHQTCTSNGLKMMKHDGKMTNLGRDMAKLIPVLDPDLWGYLRMSRITRMSICGAKVHASCNSEALKSIEPVNYLQFLESLSEYFGLPCESSWFLIRTRWVFEIPSPFKKSNVRSQFKMIQSSWPMEMFSILIGWKSNSISSLKRNDHSCTARLKSLNINLNSLEGFKQQTWILHICNCISNSKSLSCGLTLDIPKILWFAMEKNMFLVVTTDLQIFSSRSLTFSTSFMAARAAPAPETWMCHMLNCCCANALAFGMHTWSYMYLNINIHVPSF